MSKICTLFNSQGFCSAHSRKINRSRSSDEYLLKENLESEVQSLCILKQTQIPLVKNNEHQYLHLKQNLSTRHVLKETKGTWILSEQTNLGKTEFWVFWSLRNKANVASRKAGKGENLLLSQNSTYKTLYRALNEQDLIGTVRRICLEKKWDFSFFKFWHKNPTFPTMKGSKNMFGAQPLSWPARMKRKSI